MEEFLDKLMNESVADTLTLAPGSLFAEYPWLLIVLLIIVYFAVTKGRRGGS